MDGAILPPPRLRLLARVFPPAAQIREALPKVSVVPGLKRAAERWARRESDGVELAGADAGAASKRVRSATKTAKIAGRGGSKAGSTGAAAAVAAPKSMVPPTSSSVGDHGRHRAASCGHQGWRARGRGGVGDRRARDGFGAEMSWLARAARVAIGEKVRSFVRLDGGAGRGAALDPVAPPDYPVKSKEGSTPPEAEALETSCFHREGVREIVRGHRAGGEAVCHPLGQYADAIEFVSDPSSRERPTDRARLSLSRGLGSPRRRHSTSLERTCEHRTPRAVRPERIARHGADQLRDDGGGHRGGGTVVTTFAARRPCCDVLVGHEGWMEEAAADVKPGEQTKLPGADKKPPHKDPSALSAQETDVLPRLSRILVVGDFFRALRAAEGNARSFAKMGETAIKSPLGYASKAGFSALQDPGGDALAHVTARHGALRRPRDRPMGPPRLDGRVLLRRATKYPVADGRVKALAHLYYQAPAITLTAIWLWGANLWVWSRMRLDPHPLTVFELGFPRTPRPSTGVDTLRMVHRRLRRQPRHVFAFRQRGRRVHRGGGAGAVVRRHTDRHLGAARGAGTRGRDDFSRRR